MNEPGAGEFLSPEEQAEKQKNDHYESVVSDDEVRGSLAAAGKTALVREFLWKVKNTTPEDDGKLSDPQKEELHGSVTAIFQSLELEDLAEEDKNDESKKSDWDQKNEQNQKAREAFTKVIANTTVGESDLGLSEALEYESASEKAARLLGEGKDDEALDAVNIPKEDREKHLKVTAGARILVGKENLTPAEMQSIKDAWNGLKKEDVEFIVESSNLSDEQKSELLDGLPLMNEEEIQHDKADDEEADNLLNNAGEQIKEGEAILEASDMPEEQKMSYRARLRVLNNKLEEMKMKKIARGIGKGLVLSAIALALLFIWELQLFGKMSKKK